MQLLNKNREDIKQAFFMSVWWKSHPCFHLLLDCFYQCYQWEYLWLQKHLIYEVFTVWRQEKHFSFAVGSGFFHFAIRNISHVIIIYLWAIYLLLKHLLCVLFITIIIVALSIDGVNIGRMYTIFRFPSHVATLTTLKEIPYYLLDPSALGWNDP